MKLAASLVAAVLTGAAAVAGAQGWSPQKNVEIVREALEAFNRRDWDALVKDAAFFDKTLSSVGKK